MKAFDRVADVLGDIFYFSKFAKAKSVFSKQGCHLTRPVYNSEKDKFITLADNYRKAFRDAADCLLEENKYMPSEKTTPKISAWLDAGYEIQVQALLCDLVIDKPTNLKKSGLQKLGLALN